MSSLKDRYASSINSSNLKSRPDTTHSDSDVLGAYGIADRRLCSGEDHYTKHPLAVPLERLFSGDHKAATEITAILAGIIRGKAKSLKIKMAETQAIDMARAALGWFQKPACQVCKGHGFRLIVGTKTLGDSRCRPCDGTGKVIFENLFRIEQRELVRWVMSRLEMEANLAGPAAMKALAPSLDL